MDAGGSAEASNQTQTGHGTEGTKMQYATTAHADAAASQAAEASVPGYGLLV